MKYNFLKYNFCQAKHPSSEAFVHRQAKRSSTVKRLPFLLLLFIVSCDFGNTNIDPTRPIDANLKEILPAAITQTAHNLTSIGGRVTGIVVQHLKGIDAQPESYSQYLIDERTLDEFWKTGLYVGVLKDCHLLIQKANEEDKPHYRGIAKILMAMNLGIATAFWGEVPYEEAFDGVDNLQPKYDSQSSIYNSVQSLLEEAIEDLAEPISNNPPSNDDLIFQGNVVKWIATAKALQAKYHLHLSEKEPQTATKVLTAIQSGAFQTLENQPLFRFGHSINEANPLPLYSFERPDQLAMSDYLYQLLDSINDPRLSRLAIVDNGVPMIYHKDSTQLFWGNFDAPLPFISLTELYFIEAEAHLRLNDIHSAENVFKKAVIAHFEQLEIKVSAHQDFIQNHIHFNNQNTFEGRLEWLIQQKHIALFAQNPIEAWIDYRRTTYPKLIPSTNANSSFNPSLIIPRRYLYPISERTSNQIQFDKAIQRQGGHLLDVNIWMFE